MEIMAPEPKARTTGSKKGWGDTAGKMGAIVGAVAGGMSTGGAGAIAGASAGAGAGAMLGNMIKPGSEGTTSYDRRIVQQTQSTDQGTSARLRESLQALSQAPSSVQKEYAPNMLAAYIQSLQGKPIA